MFACVIDSYSLENPLIINKYHVQKIVIEYEPQSDTGKYHHIFFLTVQNKDLDQFIHDISTNTLIGWYIFCWNNEKIYIIFHSKAFEMKNEKYWKTLVYTDSQKYAVENGIQEVYTDFKKFLDRYMKEFPIS